MAVRARAVADGEQLADRAICAELEIVALLAELASWTPASRSSRSLSQFTQVGREHLDFEERHVWPRLRAAFSSGALAPKAAGELGRKILLARESVPASPTQIPGPRWPTRPGESAHHGSFG